MKTALIAASFLEGEDSQGNSRFERTKRYLLYYQGIRSHFGIEDIILFDNASEPHSCFDLLSFATFHNIPLHFVRNPQRLVHGPGPNDYPYCWRFIYSMGNLFPIYDKLIAIDTDGFVLSWQLADYIHSLRSGWTSFWCQTWKFPESSLFVLCRDAYPVALDYFKTPWQNRVGKLMETDLPFTHVNRHFFCGRWGETTREPQAPWMDYYGQGNLDQEFRFFYRSSSSDEGEDRV